MPVRSKRAARRGAPLPGAEDHDARTHHAARATAGGRWLVLGKDGRLTAYGIAAQGLLRWTEEHPGGPRWTGPELIPVPHLTHLSVAQGADGFVHFVGRRAVPKDDGSAVDLVSATQFQSGRPVTEWRSFGNQHKEPEKAVRFGVPTAAVGASGTLHVVVRNANGSLVLRRETAGGKWQGWQDLKVGRLRDGAAVAVTTSGRVEVVAPGEGLAMRWSQSEPDGAFHRDQDIPFGHTPGSAVALETAQERVTYYWMDEATGGVVAYRPGTWAIPLGGSASNVPVAALRAVLDGYDCTVLAHRGHDGQVMLTACGTENEGGGVWWSPTGEHCAGGPALAHDAYGRVVLAVIGDDGALHIARQNREPGLALEPSVRV
ncbi:hypothetical protein ACFT7S_01855 [Streptomyces sp. NPDC057136]|uniref:hypothetical protein n=1 Tax=Streptomyces sp. NPDC057136 TaxID=3346029 RepID=UPI0036352178